MLRTRFFRLVRLEYDILLLSLFFSSLIAVSTSIISNGLSNARLGIFCPHIAIPLSNTQTRPRDFRCFPHDVAALLKNGLGTIQLASECFAPQFPRQIIDAVKRFPRSSFPPILLRWLRDVTDCLLDLRSISFLPPPPNLH